MSNLYNFLCGYATIFICSKYDYLNSKFAYLNHQSYLLHDLFHRIFYLCNFSVLYTMGKNAYIRPNIGHKKICHRIFCDTPNLIESNVILPCEDSIHAQQHFQLLGRCPELVSGNGVLGDVLTLKETAGSFRILSHLPGQR